MTDAELGALFFMIMFFTVLIWAAGMMRAFGDLIDGSDKTLGEYYPNCPYPLDGEDKDNG